MVVDMGQPGEGAPSPPTLAAWALPPGRDAVGRARVLARNVLARRGFRGDVLAEAELMVCELVTNAARHAYPPYELRLRAADEDAVVCEIVDGLEALPPLPTTASGGSREWSLADIDAFDLGALEGGRGLDMVARLSGNRLGAAPTHTCTTVAPAPAKIVWVTVGAPGAGV